MQATAWACRRRVLATLVGLLAPPAARRIVVGQAESRCAGSAGRRAGRPASRSPGADRRPRRPARPQRPRRPQQPSGAEPSPTFFGQPFTPLPAATSRVDSGRRRPAGLPRRAIGCAATRPPGGGEDNAFYCQAPDTATATPSPTTGPASTSCRRTTTAGSSRRRCHGARVRPRGAGPGRLRRRRRQHRHDETQADCFAGAGPAWVADGNAEHSRLRTPELDDVAPRLPAAARPGRHRPATTARRTAPTSTGSRPSRRASTTARPPAATTSGPTGSSPQRPVHHRRATSPATATPPTATSSTSSSTTLPAVLDQASSATPSARTSRRPTITALPRRRARLRGRRADRDLVFCADDRTGRLSTRPT